MPGEAIDSWLEAAAHRMNVPFRDLLHSVGLHKVALRQQHQWPLELSTGQIRDVGHAMAVPEQTVAQMTLAGYVTTIMPTSSRGSRRGVWEQRRPSRYCPDCLSGNGGRWPVQWRLGWVFACTRHHCLLADTCPDCGRITRERTTPGYSIPQPGRCAGAPAVTGGRTARCGADLGTSRVTRLPAGHRALATQHAIIGAIESGKVPSAIYTDQPAAAQNFLMDLKALANRMLSYGADHDVIAALPADIASDVEFARQPRDRQRRNIYHTAGRPSTGATASDAAVALVAALAILQEPDIHRAGHASRWLIAAARHNGVKVAAMTSTRWGGTPSPVAQGIQLSALGPEMKPTDQLRYRIAAERPRLPRATKNDIELFVSRVPSMMWPAFSMPLAVPNCLQIFLRPAMSAALLLVGTRLAAHTAAARLGSLVTYADVSRIVSLLQQAHHWPATRSVLTRVADYLMTNQTPIDYSRRRRLDYTDLLPESTWLDLCRQTGENPGAGAKYTAVRYAMFEELSGLPCSRAPFSTQKVRTRVPIDRFPGDLNPLLRASLEDLAAEFLAQQGVDGEALTWRPPLDLLEDLTLPDFNFGLASKQELRWILGHGTDVPQPSPGGFGTTRDTISRAVAALTDGQRTQLANRIGATEIAPAVSRAPRVIKSVKATGHGRHYSTAKAAFPPDRLRDLYIKQQLTLTQIGDLADVGQHAVSRLAREYGIPLRSGPPASLNESDRAWLHEQYIIGKRSLPDLARERGIHPGPLWKFAQAHGIPLRGRGALSHQKHLDDLRAAENAPEVLRPVLSILGGAERLRRFARVAEYPTITAAGKALGVSPSALSTQMTRLGREAGGKLLTRGTATTPMMLTDFGVRVLGAWRELQDADAPLGARRQAKDAK